MIELSILGATMNGVMIAFSFDIASANAFLFFLISSSFFIACSFGFLLTINAERSREPTKLIISRKTLKLSISLFALGLLCFLVAISSIVALSLLYYVVLAPFIILAIGYVYFSLKYETFRKKDETWHTPERKIKHFQSQPSHSAAQQLHSSQRNSLQRYILKRFKGNTYGKKRGIII